MAYREAFPRLLSATQADDPWAYGQLYRSLAPSIRGYLRLQGASDPEDLTSEVFLGALRGVGSSSGDEDRFRSWVFTIAHRRLPDERRARGCGPRLSDAAVPDAAGGDVEEDALRRLAAERVRALCAGLAPDQGNVLLLRLISGSRWKRSPTCWARPPERSRNSSGGPLRPAEATRLRGRTPLSPACDSSYEMPGEDPADDAIRRRSPRRSASPSVVLRPCRPRHWPRSWGRALPIQTIQATCW